MVTAEYCGVYPAISQVVDLDSLVYHWAVTRRRGLAGRDLHPGDVSHLARTQGVGTHAGPPRSDAGWRLARLGTVSGGWHQTPPQGGYHPGDGRQSGLQIVPYSHLRRDVYVVYRTAF